MEPNRLLKNAGMFALMASVFISITPRSFYPDRCCNYFDVSDELAFQWIQDNSSMHTLYYISSIFDDGRAYGTDAGVWIFPLKKIATNKLSFNTNWDSANVFATICPSETGEVFIYGGGREFSFDDAQLTRLKWASPVFRSGDVVIYEVSNCTVNMGME